jgi:hypothetical protein
MNSCMFTCVMSHLIGLQVGCSGTIIETLSHGIRRIPVLSCRWAFGLCLLVDAEDGCDMSLRNPGLSPSYTALQPEDRILQINKQFLPPKIVTTVRSGCETVRVTEILRTWSTLLRIKPRSSSLQLVRV